MEILTEFTRIRKIHKESYVEYNASMLCTYLWKQTRILLCNLSGIATEGANVIWNELA